MAEYAQRDSCRYRELPAPEPAPRYVEIARAPRIVPQEEFWEEEEEEEEWYDDRGGGPRHKPKHERRQWDYYEPDVAIKPAVRRRPAANAEPRIRFVHVQGDDVVIEITGAPSYIVELKTARVRAAECRMCCCGVLWRAVACSVACCGVFTRARDVFFLSSAGVRHRRRPAPVLLLHDAFPGAHRHAARRREAVRRARARVAVEHRRRQWLSGEADRPVDAVAQHRQRPLQGLSSARLFFFARCAAETFFFRHRAPCRLLLTLLT